MSEAIAQRPVHAPGGARARVLLAAGLVASVLLHVLLLGWLAGGVGIIGARLPERTVDVSLIGGEAVGALRGVVPPSPTPAPVPAASPAPPPRPRAAPRPAPRPKAITQAPAEASGPEAAALAAAQAAAQAAAREAEAAARADPLAQAGDTGPEEDDDEGASGDAARQAPGEGVPRTAAVPGPEPAAGHPAARGAAEGSTGAAGAEVTTGSGAVDGTPGLDAAGGPLFGARLPPPAAGQWKFRVFYGDYADSRAVASLDYSIELDGQRYRLRTEGRAEGLTALLYSGVLTQSSTGRLGDDGLMPEHYAEQRGKRAERHATVDWSRGEVRFSSGDARAAPVRGMQDRLSALVQLGLIARAAPERLAAGQSVDLPELSMKGVVGTRYLSHGPKVLETPEGVLQTIHLERVLPRNPGDPRIEIWLGRDHQLLPVRVRLTDENGRVLDQLLAR